MFTIANAPVVFTSTINFHGRPDTMHRKEEEFWLLVSVHDSIQLASTSQPFREEEQGNVECRHDSLPITGEW